MKVWISKYALTQGLRSADLSDTTVTDNGYLSTGSGTLFRPGDWHETYEAAAVRAEEMRVAKIRSYEKRLKQLQAMKFEVPNDG